MKDKAPARDVFDWLRRKGTDPIVRTLAIIQQLASYLRAKERPPDVSNAVAEAQREISRISIEEGGFLKELMSSRLSRVHALSDFRKSGNAEHTVLGEGSPLARARDSALAALEVARSHYHYHLATENYKIVAESYVKAAGALKSGELLQYYSESLTQVDPHDPAAYVHIGRGWKSMGDYMLALRALDHGRRLASPAAQECRSVMQEIYDAADSPEKLAAGS